MMGSAASLRVLCSHFQGPGCQGLISQSPRFRVSWSLVSGSWVSGLKVPCLKVPGPESQVLIVGYAVFILSILQFIWRDLLWIASEAAFEEDALQKYRSRRSEVFCEKDVL